MSKSLLKSDKLNCLISVLIIIGCIAAQRFIAILASPGKTVLLIEAMVFSLAIAVVYFLVISSKNTFYAILTAVFGFRMMPPSINGIGDYSISAEILYYIVSKAALVFFAFAILSLYRRQKDDKNKIKTLSILCLLVVVPFCTEIGNTLASYADSIFPDNKLYNYFIKFAMYSLACLFTLIFASKSNNINSKFICDYTLVALCVNIARRMSVIAIYTVNDYHISKSYFCWVAIYIFFFIAFFALKKSREKKA